MASKTGRKQDGTFLPGTSGNPGGRPRKGETVTDAIREFGEKVGEDGRTAREVLAEKLYRIAFKRNDAVAIAAIKYIADRWEGTPRQTMDHGGSVDFRILLPGEEPDADD